jgi:hypothetical protein
MDPPNEYSNWLQCAYGAIGGMLLRALDIKRKQPIPFKNILGVRDNLSNQLQFFNLSLACQPILFHMHSPVDHHQSLTFSTLSPHTFATAILLDHRNTIRHLHDNVRSDWIFRWDNRHELSLFGASLLARRFGLCPVHLVVKLSPAPGQPRGPIQRRQRLDQCAAVCGDKERCEETVHDSLAAVAAEQVCAFSSCGQYKHQ